MKKIILLSLVVNIIFSSCQKDLGERIEVNIKVPPFTQIRNDANVDIILSQGPVYSVFYDGYSLVFDDLDFSVNRDKLVIHQIGNFWSTGNSDIYIVVPDLSLIEVTSSGDIYGDSKFVPRGDLEIMMEGSGDIDMYLDVPELWTTIYGSGDLRLSGFADFHTIDHSGSGYIYNFGFRSEAVRIAQSGFGRSEVYARRNLYVRLRGSGDIYFIGNPYIDHFISGSGRIIDAN